MPKWSMQWMGGWLTLNPLALSSLNLPFFKWMVNGKKLSLLFEKFHEIFVLNPVGFRKLSHSSEIENDALMHREG